MTPMVRQHTERRLERMARSNGTLEGHCSAMMIYTERPTQRAARKIWDQATADKGRPPCRIWKNPNCWGGPRIAGNAWGWWYAEWDNGTAAAYPPVSWQNAGQQLRSGSDVS